MVMMMMLNDDVALRCSAVTSQRIGKIYWQIHCICVCVCVRVCVRVCVPWHAPCRVGYEFARSLLAGFVDVCVYVCASSGAGERRRGSSSEWEREKKRREKKQQQRKLNLNAPIHLRRLRYRSCHRRCRCRCCCRCCMLPALVVPRATTCIHLGALLVSLSASASALSHLLPHGVSIKLLRAVEANLSAELKPINNLRAT